MYTGKYLSLERSGIIGKSRDYNDYCCLCRYPEHVAVRRSVNGGLTHVCFSVTPAMAVSMRENSD